MESSLGKPISQNDSFQLSSSAKIVGTCDAYGTAILDVEIESTSFVENISTA